METRKLLLYLCIFAFRDCHVVCKGNDNPERCTWRQSVPLPIASGVENIHFSSMLVTQTDTPNPFWMALPPEEAEPGYLCNAARDTRIMNPSASVLVHELLGGDAGCRQKEKENGRAPLVIDIGAHVGWFTLLAASYGCRVIAVEPQPHAHMYLNASIVLNGLQDRVRLVRAAVSDDDSSRFKIVNSHDWKNWDITEVVPLDDVRDGPDIAVVRVDQLAEEDVMLLKIDVEGMEAAVLKSAERLITNFKIFSYLIESKSSGRSGDSYMKDWFASQVLQGRSVYEFYEEVGRRIWHWDIGRHVFPAQRVRDFSLWPKDQVFEDHLIIEYPLQQLEDPALSIEYPPHKHVFSLGKKVAVVTASRGFATSKEDNAGFLANYSLLVNGVSAGVVDGNVGSVIGQTTRYVSWIFPDLSMGNYHVSIQVWTAGGSEAEIWDEVDFSVQDGTAIHMAKDVTWHCERFLTAEYCS